MGKVNCPKHDDENASCEVYETHGFCFAGCGRISLEELGVDHELETKERYREDLAARRHYISNLPLGLFRGFQFPFDSRGFYICWPDTEYYKQRLFDPAAKSKYKNPSGHSQPVYRTRYMRLPGLFLVEGEINSMSVAEAFPEWDVISPGSASDFMAKKTNSFFTSLPKYDRIVIMTDRDAAGTAAAISAKSQLLATQKTVGILLVDPDANQTHLEKGIKALREEILSKLPKGL